MDYLFAFPNCAATGKASLEFMATVAGGGLGVAAETL